MTFLTSPHQFCMLWKLKHVHDQAVFKYLHLQENLTLLTFRYFKKDIIFWRIWTDFKREFTKSTFGKFKTAILFIPPGSYFCKTRLVQYNSLLFYHITFAFCVHSIKQFACWSNLWNYRLIYWFFYANRHSGDSVVCCSVTSRINASFRDKIRTHAFCFSRITVLAWLIELRFDFTYVHYLMNLCCK